MEWSRKIRSSVSAMRQLRLLDFFLAPPFLAAPRLVAPFLAAPPFFLAAPFFGILAPDSRASLSAIATACLRLATFLRPPDFSWPCLYSCMTLPTLARPLVDADFFLPVDDDFLVAINSPLPLEV